MLRVLIWPTDKCPFREARSCDTPARSPAALPCHLTVAPAVFPCRHCCASTYLCCCCLRFFFLMPLLFCCCHCCCCFCRLLLLLSLLLLLLLLKKLFSCGATVIGSGALLMSCSRVVDAFVGANAHLEVSGEEGEHLAPLFDVA